MNVNMNKVNETIRELFTSEMNITGTEVVPTDQGEILKVELEYPTHPNVLYIILSLPYEQYI